MSAKKNSGGSKSQPFDFGAFMNGVIRKKLKIIPKSVHLQRKQVHPQKKARNLTAADASHLLARMKRDKIGPSNFIHYLFP